MVIRVGFVDSILRDFQSNTIQWIWNNVKIFHTITISRIIRTISFLSTVLPSPRPGCYASRFPLPPPEGWFDWIMVGYSSVRGVGGCNDLIFSGHCSFWVLTPLVYQTFYNNYEEIECKFLFSIH
jgi:hypothetical protein